MVTDGTPARKRIRAPRGKGLRTRTGCRACRSRHVKCDEETPHCQRCRKTKRECVYDRDEQQPSAQSGSPPPSSADAAEVPPEGRAQVEHEIEGALRNDRSTEEARQAVEDQAAVPSRSPMPSGQGSVQEADQPLPFPVATPFICLEDPALPTDWDLLGTSPESAWSSGIPYTAEAASIRWFSLLATDAVDARVTVPPTPVLSSALSIGSLAPPNGNANVELAASGSLEQHPRHCLPEYLSNDQVSLSPPEIPLLHHFVQHLSAWIDLTDPGRCFSVMVPSLALRNRGLMNAVLALSARHLSLKPGLAQNGTTAPVDRTLAVQYYNETLQYLQQAMQDVTYLRSDHLLATVLIISTYEMIDGFGNGWERHLKGVFWIQRSQLIHGESEGLKKWIWWAWLRQDIWVAYKERRKILSYYSLKRRCSELDYWELVNRSFFLLGQCVNYASDKEVEMGRHNVQARMDRGQSLWAGLEEWATHFAPFDRRLPASAVEGMLFDRVWINPPSASAAMQVHHFAKMLLLDLMPATGGLRELTVRAAQLQQCVNVICGIAACTTEEAAVITSTQCLFAAATHAESPEQQAQIAGLLQSHQLKTGWPNNGNLVKDIGQSFENNS